MLKTNSASWRAHGCRAARPAKTVARPNPCAQQRRPTREARGLNIIRATLTRSTPGTASASRRIADTRIGEAFLRMLPGQLYYVPAFIFPLSTLLAGAGAVWAPAAAQYLASLPLVQALGPLSPLLQHLATTQPWSSLLSVLSSLLTAYWAFLALPLLDWVLGRDLRNEEQVEAVAEAKDALYRGVLYVYCPLHIAVLCALCHLLSTTTMHPLAFLGATISAGTAGGILFTTAHELLHGSSWADKLGASLLLAFVGYMHWTESHLAHHVKVATPEDPASARRGEPLYAFIPRSVWGNLVDGYSAEARRLQRKRIPLLSLSNRMVWWVACPLALASAAFALYGWKGLAFAVGQAVFSIIMLEAVNYIEHYGLQRSKGPDGRYERVGPRHSWNTSFMFTSATTFRLQRHADHHMHGNKPYQLLRDIPEAPQLPLSYPGAMVLALLPPLFFRVMDRRVDEYAASWELQEQQR